MPKYLIEASYTAEGLRGLQKDKASGRKQAVTKVVESLEGKVEATYFALDRGFASLISALSGKPIQGTTMDQASTQR